MLSDVWVVETLEIRTQEVGVFVFEYEQDAKSYAVQLGITQMEYFGCDDPNRDPFDFSIYEQIYSNFHVSNSDLALAKYNAWDSSKIIVEDRYHIKVNRECVRMNSLFIQSSKPQVKAVKPDQPCKVCSRMVNQIENECWYCGAKI